MNVFKACLIDGPAVCSVLLCGSLLLPNSYERSTSICNCLSVFIPQWSWLASRLFEWIQVSHCSKNVWVWSVNEPCSLSNPGSHPQWQNWWISHCCSVHWWGLQRQISLAAFWSSGPYLRAQTRFWADYVDKKVTFWVSVPYFCCCYFQLVFLFWMCHLTLILILLVQTVIQLMHMKREWYRLKFDKVSLKIKIGSSFLLPSHWKCKH